jgi:uncharacterized protein YndB with AHSA1/START domain
MTSLQLVQRIAARPAIVFEALSTPEGIAAWWGPGDMPVLAAQMETRRGGAYRVRFQTRDGEQHEAFGVIIELDPPRRLVISWNYAIGGEPEEAGRTSRIQFDLAPIEGGVELTLTQSELKNETSRLSHERGWTHSLAKLVARLGGSIEPFTAAT